MTGPEFQSAVKDIRGIAMGRLLLISGIILAGLLPARPSLGQDHATVFETRSFPIQNRVRTLILEEDLGARSYHIQLRPYTRVRDNHAEVAARRSPLSFERRFRRSMRVQRAIYDMYDRLSR